MSISIDPTWNWTPSHSLNKGHAPTETTVSYMIPTFLFGGPEFLRICQMHPNGALLQINLTLVQASRWFYTPCTPPVTRAEKNPTTVPFEACDCSRKWSAIQTAFSTIKRSHLGKKNTPHHDIRRKLISTKITGWWFQPISPSQNILVKLDHFPR